MKWTSRELEIVKSILSQSSKIDASTLKALTEELGEEMTSSKIRHAFARAGLGKPQDYLNKQKIVDSAAEDIELMTRPRTLGGMGMGVAAAYSLVEDRLGTSYQDLDPELEAEIRSEVRRLIEDSKRKEAITREVRNRNMLQDRLTKLGSAFLAATRNLSQPFDRIVLGGNPEIYDQHLFVPITDAHIGKVWKDKRGQVQFDKNTLRGRFRDVIGKIKTIKSPKTLTIWFGGDIFEAPLGNMRKNQQSKMDLIGREAYLEARSIMVSMCRELREAYPDIEISLLLTGGNHDRLTEEKEYSSEDFMIYILGDAVGAHLKEQNVKVYVLPPVSSVQIADVEFILLHGHRNKLTNETKIRALIENHAETDCQKMILQGHYHSMRWLSGKKWDCVTLPSYCGNDDFVQYDINQSSVPRFTLFQVNRSNAAMMGPFDFYK